MEAFVNSSFRVFPDFKLVRYLLVFLHFNVGFCDDCVFNHFTSQLKVLFWGFLSNFDHLLLNVLDIEVQILLLLTLALLLLKSHSIMDLGSMQTSRWASIEASLPQSLSEVVVHLDP